MRIQDKIDWAEAFRRFGGQSPITIAVYAATALLALLTARLIWAAFAPIGPIGAPPPVAVQQTNIDTAVFARFDPFFQMPGNAGPVVVSDLNIDLFGTRVDNVSGRGSAIIAAEGGEQRSYVVGDEILPGVTLHAVAFDSVTVSRGGTPEQLFLDQSVPARQVTPESVPATAVAGPATPAKPEPIARERFAAELSGQPVVENGRVSGVRLADSGDGQLLNELGLKPGDILLSVNGTRIDSASRAEDIGGLVGNGGAVEMQVKRGAELKTIHFKVAR